MYEKFGKSGKETLFHNTRHSVSMDPIVTSINDWIKRNDLPQGRLYDYARNVRNFVSLDSKDQYIDYTIIYNYSLLTWFMKKVIIHNEMGETHYRMQGKY